MVFIVVGLGGLTGSEIAPFVSSIVRELGGFAITIAILPFHFEGMRRMLRAREGLSRLFASSDSVILFPNQSLLGLLGKNAYLRDGFFLSEKRASCFIKSLMRPIVGDDQPGVRIDLADIMTILKTGKMARIGMGSGRGERKWADATTEATQLLGGARIGNANGVIVLFESESEDDLSFSKLQRVAFSVYERNDPDTPLIYSLLTRKTTAYDVKSTMIAVFDVADMGSGL